MTSPRILSGVLMIGQNANVLLVPPSKGWKTAQDFIAAAKAKPGTINYGSAGVGTATHISAARFSLAAGIQATHVPYKGGAEALTDLLGGRIDFLFMPISTALPLIRDGRVVPLMVSTATRASDPAQRADAARARTSSMPRSISLVRGLHAVEDAARYRGEIPRRRHEGAGDAGDEGEDEEARGRSDADDDGRDGQVRRQRARQPTAS